MPLFSNTDWVAARYGAHVREFQKLYEFHSLRSGSPKDFVQLAPKLASSEGFRLDFSDRVRRVRDGERGGLSAGEMLTIVGVAIGGAGISGSELELYESAGTVQVLLAGVGGWRESEPAGVGRTDRQAVAGDSEARGSIETPDVVRDERDGELDGARPGSRGSGSRGSGSHESGPRKYRGRDAGGERSGGAGGEVSPEMQEALARLEMASLQLKVYLDDIDRRMGRIEPHLDDLTAMVQSSAEHFQKLERGARGAGILDDGIQPDLRAVRRAQDGPPGVLAGEGAASEEVVRPRRLRGDETIAAAMEMASHEKEHESAEAVALLEVAGEPVVAEEVVGEAAAAEDVLAGESAAKDVVAGESVHAVADGVTARKIDSAAEGKGRPIGWARGEEIAAAPKGVEGIAFEGKAAAVSVPKDKGMVAVVAGGKEAAVETVKPKPATVLKSETGRRRWAGWGAAAAVFLVAAASVAYVYQPWRPAAGKAAAESVGASAGAEGATGTGQGGGPSGSATPANGSGPMRDGAAVLKTSAEVSGRAAANRKRSESAVRQPAGSLGGETQSPRNTAGEGGGGATPVAGATPNSLQGSPVIRAGASVPADGGLSQGEPTKDRVEGARAADVSKAPRVENLHAETTAERAAPGGGPSPQMETAAMVSRVSGAPAGGASAAPAVAGDVPRPSIGRPDVMSSTIGVSVIVAPQAIYPQQARQMGVEGKVVIQATVDKRGVVTSARVVDGPFLLRQSAQDAVLRRRYKPYLLHGDPAEFQTLVTLNYKLSK